MTDFKKSNGSTRHGKRGSKDSSASATPIVSATAHKSITNVVFGSVYKSPDLIAQAAHKVMYAGARSARPVAKPASLPTKASRAVPND
ncbi:MAG: hypothetical protein IPK60_18485 [Sandaracinaceae bacterium]|nr:hypothetical protein [Sandaracinaceae bacterium]